MYSNLLNIITDLLNHSEITLGNFHCTMNKYVSEKKSYSVDMKIFYSLYVHGVIREDSGNWESDEQHYVLDLNDYKISRLNKINFIIDNLRFNKDEVINELVKVLNNIKLKEERKLKLNNIIV